MHYLILFISFFFIGLSPLLAQGENNNWFLNGQKLFNFNNEPPSLDTFNSFNINEGYNVSVSNADGSLLFVSVGEDVMNIDGEIMPNGDDLDNAFTGSVWPVSFSYQPVAAIQSFSSTDQYYLFVLSDGYIVLEAGNVYVPGTLQYSIVDMGLEEGKGDVVAEQKNIFLADSLTGAMTTARGDCGSTWLLTHEYNTSRFFAFEITENGINEPVTSEVGNVVVNNIPQTSGSYNSIFSSADGAKIAFFYDAEARVQLFDFDRSSGIVSNPVDLPVHPSTSCGVFSHSGEYFTL